MSCFIHGDNIETKTRREPTNLLLQEIKPRYDAWRRDSLAVSGITRADNDRLVDLFQNYKSFISDARFGEEFSSQSKLQSSVLEEFMYYLLRRIPGLESGMALGTMKAYTNLFFAPASLAAMHTDCGMSIYTKNQDFAIAKTARLSAAPQGGRDAIEQTINIPVLSVECKTFIDKTMYEGSVATAERIKQGNPYSRFIIVAELYDVSLDVDPKHSKIDQIYVLRRQTRRSSHSTLNPVDKDVCWRLFSDTQVHLSSDWSNMNEKLNTGLMI